MGFKLVSLREGRIRNPKTQKKFDFKKGDTIEVDSLESRQFFLRSGWTAMETKDQADKEANAKAKKEAVKKAKAKAKKNK